MIVSCTSVESCQAVNCGDCHSLAWFASYASDSLGMSQLNFTAAVQIESYVKHCQALFYDEFSFILCTELKPLRSTLFAAIYSRSLIRRKINDNWKWFTFKHEMERYITSVLEQQKENLYRRKITEFFSLFHFSLSWCWKKFKFRTKNVWRESGPLDTRSYFS